MTAYESLLRAQREHVRAGQRLGAAVAANDATHAALKRVAEAGIGNTDHLADYHAAAEAYEKAKAEYAAARDHARSAAAALDAARADHDAEVYGRTGN